jgi:hypothetical protein
MELIDERIKQALEPLNARIVALAGEIVVLKHTVEMNHVNYIQDVKIFAPDFICNLATQVLLFYLHVEPDDPRGAPNYFKSMARGTDANAFEFCTGFKDRKDLSGKACNAFEWAEKFDNIIHGRNITNHLKSWEELAERVRIIRALCLRHHHLKDALKDEFFVILNFDSFRFRGFCRDI